MKKKLIMSTLCVMCCVSLASCGNNNKGNQGKDPLTGQSMEQSQEMQSSQTETDNNDSVGNGDEFDRILNEATDVGDVVTYVTSNLANATETEARRLFGGLFGYGNDVRDIDYTQFDESRQYLSEDMIAYLDLMKLESDTPSMVMSDTENRKVIGLTLSEMLERALLFEKHIEKYPDAISTEPASRLYEEIATNAITGGYDKTNGVEHYYKGDSADVIDQESLKYYQQFVDANPDTRLGGIVKEYINVLQQNNFQLNENVENFYHGLYQKLFPEQA